MSEHSKERENEDFSEWTGESFDIDQEWQDLNDLMNQEIEISPSELKFLEVQQRHQTIYRELIDKLAEYDMPILMDNDTNQEVQLEIAFFNGIRDQKIEENETWADRELTGSEKKTISIDCLLEFYEEKEYQTVFLNHAANFAHAQRFPEDTDIRPAIMTILKKHIQALAFVQKGWGPDSGWQQLLDAHSTDFDGLSFVQAIDGRVTYLQPSDERYVDDSRASHQEYQAESRKRRQLIFESLKIIGLDMELDDEQKIMDCTIHLLNMLGTAGEQVASKAEITNRRNNLWQLARRLDASDEKLARIVELFDASYPPEV